MRGLRKYGNSVFIGIVALVLAQVGWWAYVFTRDVARIADLETQNAQLQARLDASSVPPSVFAAIQSQANRHRTMFLSETLFFAGVACVGLWLLYRALRSERHSREVQRSFIDTVSHESKTPLTALKLRLESLRENAADAATAKHLELSLDEVRRLSGVFEKAMELNRSERHVFEFERLLLSDVVESVIHRLEPWLQAKGAKVHCQMDLSLEVNGDFSALQNSVQSLLENAVLYSPPEKREVEIQVAVKGTRAVLSIADRGPGIAVGDRQRVFERFYRGESGRSVPGTGLGLYLARLIVHAHRGVLRLVDVPEGARFEILLPKAGPA